MTPMQIDMTAVPFITSMMNNGIEVDLGYLKSLGDEFDGRLSQLQYWIDAECGHHLNPNSSDQVLKWCEYHKIKDYAGKKLKSADSESLAPIRNKHKVVDLILQYKELDKLNGTYVKKFPRMVDANNRIHTSFSITSTDTFRLASKDPNMQNISKRTKDGKRVRGAFIPSKGKILLGADYSAQELRWTACMSGDSVMLDVYLTGKDLHLMTEKKVFKTENVNRVSAKTINFSTIYGISPRSLWLKLLTMGIFEFTEADCAMMINGFFELYPGVKSYIDYIEQKVMRDGYIDSYYGYRALIPEINSVHEDVRAKGLREAVNFTIQNPSAAQTKIAMGNLHREMLPFGKQWRGLLQIHDELMTEVDESLLDEASEILVACMETAEVNQELVFTAEPKIGYRWSEMVEIN